MPPRCVPGRNEPAGVSLRPASLAVFALLLLVTGGACGDDEPADSVVEATPEVALPPLPPPPSEPGRLHYLILDEVVVAPPGSAWSPLHRTYGPASLERPDPDFLRDDNGGEEVAGMLSDWLAGSFPSAAELLLVQWSMAWGEHGEAGNSRNWGVCMLPCVLNDDFVAGNGRHPADPIEDALALFAGRPGAQDLTVSIDDGVLEVRNGGLVLLGDDDERRVSEAKTTWKVSFAAPDGTLGKQRPFPIGRRLSVLHHSVEDLAIQEVTEPPPSKARLYPDLSKAAEAVPPKVRGVEGLPQLWAWEEANKFEGQFGIRPPPGDEGLSVERIEQQVRWVPTARQAGDGEAAFAMYSASSGGISAVFKPFPRGALVMGATVGLVEGATTKFRVAGQSDGVSLARAQEVLESFTRFQGVLPLPEGLPDEVLVYLSPQPVGVIGGGAGAAPFSLVVDERRSEQDSVARAWAHLLLGANVRARSSQAADWVRWVEARLLGTEDRSLWGAVFASAGDDVLEVWLQRMRDPKHAGAPDPEEFLRWASAKIPVLGRELYRKLPTRQWLVGSGLNSLPLPLDGEFGVSLKGRKVPYGAAVPLQIPEAAGKPGASLSLVVTPGDGASVHWSSQFLQASSWSEARGDLAKRETVAAGWDSFQRATGEAVPLAPPDTGIGEDAVLVVFLRGQAPWKAQMLLRVVVAEATATAQ